MLQLRTHVDNQSALDQTTVLLFALHFQWRLLRARLEKVEAIQVVSFFSDVIDVARSDSPPSQGVLDGIERLRQAVMRLLALERRGKRVSGIHRTQDTLWIEP